MDETDEDDSDKSVDNAGISYSKSKVTRSITPSNASSAVSGLEMDDDEVQSSRVHLKGYASLNRIMVICTQPHIIANIISTFRCLKKIQDDEKQRKVSGCLYRFQDDEKQHKVSRC